MIKHEIKVEFSNSQALKSIIQKAYFDEGYMMLLILYSKD